MAPPTPTAALALRPGASGCVAVLPAQDGFRLVAGDLDDPDRHDTLTVSRSALAAFAAEVLAYLPGRPTQRVSVPFDQPHPVAVALDASVGRLALLDDGIDLVLFAQPSKRGASRLAPAAVESFARQLVEVTAA